MLPQKIPHFDLQLRRFNYNFFYNSLLSIFFSLAIERRVLTRRKYTYITRYTHIGYQIPQTGSSIIISNHRKY